MTVTAKLRQTPYEGKPQAIPGRVEVEKYDDGIDGYAFHDSDNTNEGGKLRTDGVDVVDGGTGFAIGYTVAGEWMNYTVNVEKTMKYAWLANVASGSTGAGFKLFIDNNQIATVKIPQTANNSWSTYKVVTGLTTAEIPAGEHVLKLQITGAYGNIDYVEFSTDTASVAPVKTAIDEREAAELAGDYDVYTTAGVKIGTAFICKGESVEQQLKKAVGRTGAFILRNAAGQSRIVFVQ